MADCLDGRDHESIQDIFVSKHRRDDPLGANFEGVDADMNSTLLSLKSSTLRVTIKIDTFHCNEVVCFQCFHFLQGNY